WIKTGGLLRADGTVLAYWAYQSTPDEEEYFDALCASGVVDAVQGSVDVWSPDAPPASITVNGNAYSVYPAETMFELPHDGLLATDPTDGDDVAIDPIAAGDTVLVMYWLDDSGVRFAKNVVVRMSGADTRLAGTVTA